MVDISVIVSTYNQEDTIAETLESIKYQLETYHVNQRIQLIIADDGSADRTTEVVCKWLKDNESLFESICKLFSEENKGTCKNFAGACRKALGNRIITIAGDDIWANTDVIGTVLKCGEMDIIACPPLKFKQGKIILEKDKYYSEIKGALYDAKEIIKRSRFSCPVINGAVIGKTLYDEEILAFSEKYDLLDDQARFTKMFEKYQNFRYKYQDEPIMLYRISDKQVTNTNNDLYKRIVKDKIQLTEYILKNEKSLSIRIAARCEELRVVNPRKFEKIWKFVYWGAYQDILFYKRNFSKIDAIAEHMMAVATEKNMDAYLAEIHSRAQKYRIN